MGGGLDTGVDLTYSFGGAGSVYRAGYGNGEPLNGFGSLTNIQKTAANNALQAYQNVANITFTEVQDLATVAGDDSVALIGVRAADLDQDDFALI